MTLDLTVQTERMIGRQYHIYRNCFRICCKTVITACKKKKKIGVRPCQLLQLVKEKDRSWIPRNSLNESQKQKI